MSKKISFCSLMAVLGIISLILTVFLRANTVFLYLLSTIFTYICTEEYGVKYGLLTCAVISLAGFIILPEKITLGLYAVTVSYYPAVKHIIEHLNFSRAMKWLMKILFAVAVSSVAFIVFSRFLTLKISFWIIYPLALAVFVLYDIALTIGIKFYALRLRKFR